MFSYLHTLAQYFFYSIIFGKSSEKTTFHIYFSIDFLTGDRPIRASAQKNVTEEGDDRRWKAYSVLEYVFSQDDYGKNLICRVNHPAYANEYEEASVKLDLLCKY